MVSWTNQSKSRRLGPISSTQECHPTHLWSIGGHLLRSYAVEALSGPLPLPNRAHSSAKLALRGISRNLDGWNPFSMPLHPLRSVIQHTLHLLEVIYPGHMQSKHCWGHHHHLTGPIPEQNGLLDNKSESGWLGPVIHATSSNQKCHLTCFPFIESNWPRSYAVEALLGPSPLHNVAHKSSKRAVGRISRNLDTSEMFSMPFYPLRSVIQPALHLLDVIYPGHMQWKHFRACHNCLWGPIPAQNGLSKE